MGVAVATGESGIGVERSGGDGAVHHPVDRPGARGPGFPTLAEARPVTVLPLRYYGDPILREKAAPYETVDDGVRRLADDMVDTMYAAQGIGLAGNQIGVARRILVIDVSEDSLRKRREERDPGEESTAEVYLNAEVVESSVEDGDYNEGCLSIPGVDGDVWRPNRVRVKWTDLDGNAHDEWFDEMRARVLQHEIDHLDGVLFVDHLSIDARKNIAGALNRLKRETQERLDSESA